MKRRRFIIKYPKFIFQMSHLFLTVFHSLIVQCQRSKVNGNVDSAARAELTECCWVHHWCWCCFSFTESGLNVRLLSSRFTSGSISSLIGQKPFCTIICEVSASWFDVFSLFLQLALSSDKISSLNTPLLSLGLDVRQNGVLRPVTMEMNREELSTLICSLEAANKVHTPNASEVSPYQHVVKPDTSFTHNAAQAASCCSPSNESHVDIFQALCSFLSRDWKTFKSG